MRLLAGLLAERGVNVRGPDRADSRRLTVTSARQTRCEITVDDDGGIYWECLPSSGSDTEPAELCGIVLRILGAHDRPVVRASRFSGGYTLKGAVARAVHERGLRADLEVYEDLDMYHVVAEVVLANPAKPERGLVRVTDDGAVRWEYGRGDVVICADTTARILRPVPSAGAGR